MTQSRVIYRGSAFTWTLKIPVAQWTAGNYILFAAKRTPDDDPTDSEASIKKTFDDSYIASTIDGFKVYQLVFTKTDTEDAKLGSFYGEFRVADSGGGGGKPSPTFPVEIKPMINNRSPV